MAGDKVVLVIGAGSTYAESILAGFDNSKRPPLNAKFFKLCQSYKYKDFQQVKDYMEEHYKIDITTSNEDYLEKVLVTLYSDSFHSDKDKKAFDTFQTIIRLFNRVLAHRTNAIPVIENSYLFRLLKSYLDKGISPNDITIITFNYDIHIEKVLELLNNKVTESIFCFPSCYKLGISTAQTTSPTKSENSPNLFTLSDKDEGIKVLKMHGSLNWFSNHNSKKLSLKMLLDPNREIYITTRKSIAPDMTFNVKRKRFTFPIIVPPVVHKAGVLHNRLHQVWDQAELALASANQMVIFGYSCPVSDIESANLIERAVRSNTEIRESTTSISQPTSDNY